MQIIDKYKLMKTDEIVALARKDDDHAMVELASRLYSGKNADKSYELARSWYEAAADKGNVTACYEYGQMLFAGIGGDEDPEKAFEYYKKAADGGNRDAMFELAAMYSEGIVVKKNYLKATNYLHESGTPAATAMLQKCYGWWKPAAEHGMTEGEYQYGLCLVNGYGTSQNMTEGVSFIYKAALKGHVKAMNALVQIYTRGIGGMEVDKGKAAYWENEMKKAGKEDKN